MAAIRTVKTWLRSAEAPAMRNYGIRQVQSPAHILLICPDCGHENSELATALRRTNTYWCEGEDCDYSFDLAGARRDAGSALAEACKRFYAMVYPLRRLSLR
jgi:hypothetical protein